MNTVHRRPPLLSYNIQPQGASVVYWIHRACHTDMFSEGYIGITNRRANRRWSEHKRMTSNCNAVNNAIKKYDDVMFDVVLVADTRTYCEYIEKQLRPHKNIGWNIKEGGDDAMPINQVNPMAGGIANKNRIDWLKANDPEWIAKEEVKRQHQHDKNEALIVRLIKRVKRMTARAEYESHRNNNDRKVSIHNKSGYTGVTWHTYKSGKGIWHTQFKGKSIGYFHDVEAAHHAYLEAKRNAL